MKTEYCQGKGLYLYLGIIVTGSDGGGGGGALQLGGEGMGRKKYFEQ